MTDDPGPGSGPDIADESAPADPLPASPRPVDPRPASPGPVGGPERVAGPSAVAVPGVMAYPPAMLAGTADRERAIDVLKAGFAEGRLTQSEHDERSARVYAARTYADLAAVVADLPAGPGCGPYQPAAGYPPAAVPARPGINGFAVASLICGLAELPTLGVSAFPAVILGIRARQQIRQTGQRGDGVAIAGLILGWTGTVLFLAAILGIMILLMLPAGPGTSGPIGS
jgi:Domain of unknown function (DUF1707)/Domain of unknown function (DUF4190)